MKIPSFRKGLQKLKSIDYRAKRIKFCDFLYLVGIQSVRVCKRVLRRLRWIFHPVVVLLGLLYRHTLGRYLHKLWVEFKHVGNGFHIAGKRLGEARREGAVSAAAEFFHIAGRSFRRHSHIFSAVFNIAAPVAAVFLLILTIRYWNGLNFGLELSYGGESAGVIQNEKTFSQASQMVSQRMVHSTDGHAQDEEVKLAPLFRLTITSEKTAYTNADAVCDAIIRQSSGVIEEATGLYVENKLVGAVKSSADLSYLLQSVLNRARGEDKAARVEFAQSIKTATGLFPTAALMATSQMQEYLTGYDKEGSVYTVREGDTLSGIAEGLGVTVEELFRLNGNALTENLQVGQLITVETAVPRIGVKVTKTETYEQELPFETVVEKDESQFSDYTRVATEGQNGVQQCTDNVTYLNGNEVARESVSRVVTSEPVAKVVVAGVKKRPTGYTPGESSGVLIWPVPSLHTITSTFGGRWGRLHSGIDISGGSAYGRPIVAADGGVVELAGWYDGYGLCVIIRHANGMETLYGHCSALLVSVGQAVAKGQTISQVGNTGNSYGAHCHFEVRMYGQRMDPLNYVS